MHSRSREIVNLLGSTSPTAADRLRGLHLFSLALTSRFAVTCEDAPSYPEVWNRRCRNIQSPRGGTRRDSDI